MPVDYETKIVSVGEAAREFLTIVIGLALAYAIATRAPEFEGIQDGDIKLNWQIEALFVYIIYASRFYVNNWLYLAESYNEATIRGQQLNKSIKQGRHVLMRVYFDLFLTIYTALIISIVPLFFLSRNATQAKVAFWLMCCLIAHYAFDAVALVVTTVFSTQTTLLNRTRSRLWIANNALFAGMFVVYYVKYGAMAFNWLLLMLLLNSAIAIAITLITPVFVYVLENRNRPPRMRAGADG